MKGQKVDTKLGIVIIIIFAITVGVFVWKYEGIMKQDETQIQSITNTKKNIVTQPTPENKQGLDITDVNNWKSYSNDELGYSLKYPQGYEIQGYDSPCTSKLNNETGQNIVIWVSDFINKNDKAYADDVESGRTVNFSIVVDDPQDKCLRNAYSWIGGPKALTPKILGSETINVNGQIVLKRNYGHLNPEGKVSTYHFSTWRFKKNNRYYTVMFNNGTRIMNPEQQNNLFKKFLDNFHIE